MPSALSAVILCCLLALAARHPHLRFVDMIGFSRRAQALSATIDPLYPVGYPALLAGLHALGADVLVAGKAISAFAGAGATLAASLWLSPAAGLAAIAQAEPLTRATTEGTDMLAAALALGALAVANPHLAGALAGAACLTRYTSAAVVPVVLVATRGRALPAFLLATLPHWGVALATGACRLPRRDRNSEIGGGAATVTQRWPEGFARALVLAVPDWPSRIAALGIGVGLWRRDPRAAKLLAWALLHCAGVAVAFANTRLCLPAGLALALGAHWLVPPRLLAPLAVALGVWNARAVVEEPLWERALADIVAETGDIAPPVVANSPWFHLRRDGWLLPGIQLNGLVPRGADPDAVRAAVVQTGATTLVLEKDRTRRDWPRLQPMLHGSPPGWKIVETEPNWRVLAMR